MDLRSARRGRRDCRAEVAKTWAAKNPASAVAEVNKYVTDTAPWTLKADDQRERLGTVLHVVAQCVSDLNLVLSPFLTFSANTVDAVFGGSGDTAPLPRIDEVDDLDGGPGYPIITGDYTSALAWARRPLVVGSPVAKPTPVFTKLDPQVAEDELRIYVGTIDRRNGRQVR